MARLRSSYVPIPLGGDVIAVFFGPYAVSGPIQGKVQDGSSVSVRAKDGFSPGSSTATPCSSPVVTPRAHPTKTISATRAMLARITGSTSPCTTVKVARSPDSSADIGSSGAMITRSRSPSASCWRAAAGSVEVPVKIIRVTEGDLEEMRRDRQFAEDGTVYYDDEKQ